MAMQIQEVLPEGLRNYQCDLMKACEDGDVNLASEAVSFGVDINKEEKWRVHPFFCRSTPLIVGILQENVDIVRYLLEQGADVNKVDDEFGWSPLHFSARFNVHDESIAMLLMSYGADLNATTNITCYLPLDFAYSEAMKQAIRDEPRRRMDHGYKRATEQDRHPNAAATALAQQEEEGEEEMHSNKRQRTDETTVASAGAEETNVASEDEDSESSDIEDDCY